MPLSSHTRTFLKAGASLLGLGGLYVTLFLLERKHPLREKHESKLRRNARNLAVAGLTAATLQIAERPLVQPLAKRVNRRNSGLLPRLHLPRPLETVLAVVLMDYTLYLWHVLTHRVPFLWRFHKVHHADLDLDASTALRFHFGEMFISVAWRAAQVTLIGVRPRALGIWQAFLFVSILFHHSNVRLPAQLERWLCRFVMTPRLHGIHHSARDGESEANWSSGLTVWDWLHGTLRGDVAQDTIPIGIAEVRAPEDVVLPKVLAMPFRKQHGAGAPTGNRGSRSFELAV